MGIPGRRKRGRPKRRYMAVMGEDMRVVGVTEDDTGDRAVWRRLIRCGDLSCITHASGNKAWHKPVLNL